MPQEANGALPEELVVLFHASLLGRTDVVQSAIASIREKAASAGNGADNSYLSKEISVGRPDDDCTPLHVAALFGHADVVRSLLHAGASLTAYPQKGEYAGKRPYELAVESSRQAFHVYLFEQIAMGNVDVITKLLIGGVPVDIRDGSKTDDGTLHWAVSFGSTQVAKLLLSYGFQVNQVNADGQSCLHVACKSSNMEIIEMLLGEGADPNIVDKSGKNPLQCTPPGPNFEKVQRLLSQSPSPEYPLRELFLKTYQQTLLPPVLPTVTDDMTSNVDNSDDSTNVAGSSLYSSSSSSSAVSPSRAKQTKSSSTANNAAKEGGKSSSTSTSDVLDACYDEYDDADNEDEASDSEPLLVFWPPTQRQKRRSLPPLVLDSANVVLICVASAEIDIFPLLTWSGLMDTIDRFGLKAQVKRSSPGAKVRLCVDANLCPGRHSFEIQVGPDQACLTASDSTGLLYAVYAFVQLLQLHSDVSVRDGVTSLFVPSIILRDWPDVENRGVMWSYRKEAQVTAKGMKDTIEMLSRVRINILLLVVDPSDVEEIPHSADVLHVDENTQLSSSSTSSSSSSSSTSLSTSSSISPSSSSSSIGDDMTSTHSNVNSQKITTSTSSQSMSSTQAHTRIYALDEICRRHCVDLIPTVIITASNQTLPLDVLKNFSQKMICLVLAMTESIGDEACIELCERTLLAVQQAGFTSVILSSTEYVRKVAKPTSMAMQTGLGVAHRTLNQLISHKLFVRPVICVHDFVTVLKDHSSSVIDEGANLSVLPAFSDSEYMYPSLLSKYFCFLYAAFVWNRASASDMIGDVSPDGSSDFSIVREVASLLIFTQQSERAALAYKEVLSLFTGELLSSSTSQQPGGSQTNQQLPPPVPSASQTEGNSCLSHIEKLIWTILTGDDACASECIAPSKAGAALCLRYYRRVLNAAGWRAGGKQTGSSGLLMEFAGIHSESSAASMDSFCDSEMDELLALIHLMSVVCRAVVLAYTALEKKTKIGDNNSNESITFNNLLRSLPPGTKSDVANSLLEALEHCVSCWRKRYDRSWVVAGQNQLFATSSSKSTAAGATTNADGDKRHALKLYAQSYRSPLAFSDAFAREGRRKFLSHEPPCVPATAAFMTISESLPVPRTFSNIFSRLFG